MKDITRIIFDFPEGLSIYEANQISLEAERVAKMGVASGCSDHGTVNYVFRQIDHKKLSINPNGQVTAFGETADEL